MVPLVEISQPRSVHHGQQRASSPPARETVAGTAPAGTSVATPGASASSAIDTASTQPAASASACAGAQPAAGPSVTAGAQPAAGPVNAGHASGSGDGEQIDPRIWPVMRMLGSDRPYRSKHTQMCTPSLGMTAL